MCFQMSDFSYQGESEWQTTLGISKAGFLICFPFNGTFMIKDGDNLYDFINKTNFCE